MELFRSRQGTDESCMMGTLPSCAPLANPYVPFQQYNPETYPAPRGMIRGTMYPSLDLPFRGMSNETEKTGTALLQLQALYFAIADLGLYLDTHATDQDAIALYNQYVEQYTDAMQKYERQHGSLTQMDSAMNGHYDWLKDPWPWDYDQNKEA